MTEFLDAARRDINERLTELRGDVTALERAHDALGGNRPQPGTAGRRTPGRRRGRRPGGGTRALQAEELVRDNPGITIPDLAARMKIKPNYLYRVLPELQKDGKIRKRGKEWHPVA